MSVLHLVNSIWLWIEYTIGRLVWLSCMELQVLLGLFGRAANDNDEILE